MEDTTCSISQKITINILGYFKGLVKEHLQLFERCIQSKHYPKTTFLIHLPSQIVQFGPVVRVWAMRFEAKHQQLKKIPKTTKNFKNLPKTSSERHQSGVRADAIPLTSDPSA